MLVLSVITDTQIWIEYFNYQMPVGECHHVGCDESSRIDGERVQQIYQSHYHWNYRGWVYTITGVVYFVLNGVRIVLSHKEEDFK